MKTVIRVSEGSAAHQWIQEQPHSDEPDAIRYVVGTDRDLDEMSMSLPARIAYLALYVPLDVEADDIVPFGEQPFRPTSEPTVEINRERLCATHHSRKRISRIAKIPLPLAQWIARTYKPFPIG